MGSYSAYHLYFVWLPGTENIDYFSILSFCIYIFISFLSENHSFSPVCFSVKRHLWKVWVWTECDWSRGLGTPTLVYLMDQHKRVFLAGILLNFWFPWNSLFIYAHHKNSNNVVNPRWQTAFFSWKLILKSSSESYIKSLRLFALPLDYWMLFILHKNLRVFTLVTQEMLLSYFKNLNLVPEKGREDIPAFERDVKDQGWFSAFHLDILYNTNWREKHSF